MEISRRKTQKRKKHKLTRKKKSKHGTGYESCAFMREQTTKARKNNQNIKIYRKHLWSLKEGTKRGENLAVELGHKNET